MIIGGGRISSQSLLRDPTLGPQRVPSEVRLVNENRSEGKPDKSSDYWEREFGGRRLISMVHAALTCQRFMHVKSLMELTSLES